MEQRIAAVLTNQQVSPTAVAVLGVLQDHQGKNKALKRVDLITTLEFKRPEMKFNERKVRAAIRELVEDFHIPVTGSSNEQSRGYYIVADEQEREAAVNDLRSRVDSLLARIGALETIQLGGIGDVAAA
jgi:hypothetical protein